MLALMVPSFRVSVYVGPTGVGPLPMPRLVAGPGHQAAKYPPRTVASTGPCSMVLMTTETTSEPAGPATHQVAPLRVPKATPLLSATVLDATGAGTKPPEPADP